MNTATRLSEDELKSIIQGPADVEWRCVSRVACSIFLRMLFGRYEMRRECQEILPGLLLGPFVASKSLETLKEHGITHMCVA